MSIEYSVGIDPGKKNFGIAILKRNNGKICQIDSSNFDFSNSSSIYVSASSVIRYIMDVLVKDGGKEATDKLTHAAIERFVSYNNTFTKDSETIITLIGAMTYALPNAFSSVQEVDLYRAIEWKVRLVKLLVKSKGFSNPSTSLDKKFSIAAAHACLDLDTEFKTDHEADATCIGSLRFLSEGNCCN